jgi:hypothetical protein
VVVTSTSEATIPKKGRYCGRSTLLDLAIPENGRFCGQTGGFVLAVLVFGLFLRMGWSFWLGHPCFTPVFEDG